MESKVLKLDNFKNKELVVYSTDIAQIHRYRIETANYNGNGDKVIFKCQEYNRLKGTYEELITIFEYTIDQVFRMSPTNQIVTCAKKRKDGKKYFEKVHIN